MDSVEIVDRLKLLIVDNPNFDDFRRSIDQQDLNSIFRFVNDNNKEDFRKVVVEQNHYSLIRLLKTFTSSRIIEVFDMILKNEHMDPDCMSRSQIRCKKWLVEEVAKHNIDLGTVFLCAGWYGILAMMIFESNIQLTKIRNFDIDENCKSIAEKINLPWIMDDWKYKHCVQDIHQINYDTHVYNVIRGDGSVCELTDSPDTIINTSCEHIENFTSWYQSIPNGKFVVLQTNNYTELAEHINCVENVEQFVQQTPMSKRLYQGQLETPKYTRFMTFGYK